MTIKAIAAVKPTVINANTVSITTVSANDDSLRSVEDVLLKQYNLRLINPQVIDGVINFDTIEISDKSCFDLSNIFTTQVQDRADAKVSIGDMTYLVLTTMYDSNCFMFDALECVNLELCEEIEYSLLKQATKAAQLSISGYIDSDTRYTDSEVLLYPNCNISVLCTTADMLAHRTEEVGGDFSLVSNGELQTINYGGLSLTMVNRALFDFDGGIELRGIIRCGDNRYNVTALATHIDVGARMDAALLIIHGYESPIGYSIKTSNPISAINFCVSMYYDQRLTSSIKAVAVNRLSMEHTWVAREDSSRRYGDRHGFGRDRRDRDGDRFIRDARRSRDRDERRDRRDEERALRSWVEEPTSNLDKLEAQQEKKNK